MYRRLRQVEKTHSGMLPQSRTLAKTPVRILEGEDHAGERQSAEGFLCMCKNMEPVADTPEGRRS